MESVAEVAAAGPYDMRTLAERVRRRIHEAIGITTAVTVVSPKSLERSVGKAKRVHDLRAEASGETTEGGRHA